jgi:hypothetical protein
MTGGECWTKDGRPKRRWSTRALAKTARRRYVVEFGADPGRPYRCGRCGFFHLGHYPQTDAIRARLRSRHRGEAS